MHVVVQVQTKVLDRLLLMPCAATPASPASGWTRPTSSGDSPPPRNSHTAAVWSAPDDSKPQRMLLFGGSSPTDGPMNDFFIMQPADGEAPVVAPQGSGGAPHGFGITPSPADMLSPYQTGAPSLGQQKAPVDRHLTEEKCTVALFAVMRRGRCASGTLVMRCSPHLLLLATWALCVTTRRRGAWQARCACPGSRAQRRKVHQRFVLVGPRCGRLLLGSACGTAHNSPFLVDLSLLQRPLCGQRHKRYPLRDVLLHGGVTPWQVNSLCLVGSTARASWVATCST